MPLSCGTAELIWMQLLVRLAVTLQKLPISNIMDSLRETSSRCATAGLSAASGPYQRGGRILAAGCDHRPKFARLPFCPHVWHPLAARRGCCCARQLEADQVPSTSRQSLNYFLLDCGVHFTLVGSESMKTAFAACSACVHSVHMKNVAPA